jgi:hypothetical protein
MRRKLIKAITRMAKILLKLSYAHAKRKICDVSTKVDWGFIKSELQ